MKKTKKNINISVKFSQEDLDALRIKADRLEMAPSTLIRKLTMHGLSKNLMKDPSWKAGDL